MIQSIADIRKEYTKQSMNADDLEIEPIAQFRKWFQHAIEAEVMEPNAMNLATINPKGGLSSRIVLLKDIDDDGIVFYTNYDSEKGVQIMNDSQVAINFFWPELERQVRMEGKAEKVEEIRSEAYFKSRPRSSQIGAWVSPQSAKINERGYLEQRQKEFEIKFEGKVVPKPKNWGGYKVTISMMEFWQGRPSRLHDRFRFELNKSSWIVNRLAP